MLPWFSAAHRVEVPVQRCGSILHEIHREDDDTHGVPLWERMPSFVRFEVWQELRYASHAVLWICRSLDAVADVHLVSTALRILTLSMHVT
jgi:hypothetical protein